MSGLAGIGSGMLHGQSAQQAAAAQQGQVLADGKRGPVEFNHAINYVNKIKNRFSDSPEIYKQFLEILQTYQRESKPIQDVYAQVTVLFNSAPDLLEDFKQFLPESAAPAQTPTQQSVQPTPGRGNYATIPPAQLGGLAGRQPQSILPEDIPIMHSDIRNEPRYAAMAAAPRGSPVMGGQRMPDTGKMPPMGQFHVKESYKDAEKRRANAAATTSAGAPGAGMTASGAVPAGVPLPMSTAAGADVTGAGRMPHNVPLGNANKRAKLSHKTQQDTSISVSPTLIPALPEPIPPTFSFAPSSEEYAFFDRVKKFIGNKQTFGEFLKLCNLYSADLIDKNVLVNRAQGFIGANPEIMAWFKRFMHVEPTDELIEPQARMEAASTSAPVTLAHCRALGPSYRLLPKRERQKPCSGRDELCQSVLNDEWASHPTWESEDSGFVAHRKNQFEDALHRIEEDRHEYDHHIEGCVRTIQLMEPLVQQLAGMTSTEVAKFQLPPGLGGQSETIYRRVIKKVYDRVVGESVIQKMFSNPEPTLPIVLKRLKQKCEEWKLCQREWDKVWREQMQRSFWKSLDHQANTTKSADKKLFVAKHIQNEITAKLEESKNLRKSGFQTPAWQFEYEFSDSEVLLDTTHLLLCHIERNSAGFGADPNKVMSFLKDFVPAMFGLDRDAFKMALREGYDDYSPSSENGETGESTDETANDDADSVAIKSRRVAAASSRKLDLLRDVLERQGMDAERSRRATPVSGASTPAQVPRSVPMASEAPEFPGPVPEEITPSKWMEHPGTGNFNATESREYPLNAPYKKKVHTMYANVHIYCFLHSFEVLYSRLLRVKRFENRARMNIQRAAAPKAAYKLGMIDKAPSDLLYDTSPDASYYQQIVRMCEDIIKGDLEQSHLEETLRRFFLQVGWQLYNLDKILVGIARFAGGIFNPDPKDKSSEIMALFFKEREKKETTHYHEIHYRKSVERLIREGDLYRITFIPATKKVTIQLMSAEDSTLDSNELSPEARWSYYVSAYSMRDPTEGVPISRMRLPFLQRSLPTRLDQDDDEYNQWFSPLVNHDKLVIRICATSYHIRYEAHTEDWFYRLFTPQQGEGEGGRSAAEIEQEREREQAAIRDRRRDRFKRKFVNNPVWARGLSKDDVDLENQKFRSWVGSTTGEKLVKEAQGETSPEKVKEPAAVLPSTEPAEHKDGPNTSVPEGPQQEKEEKRQRNEDDDEEMVDAPAAEA
ncbi:hypothetical protein KEM56_000607 [Ascosphaera pollenicola]|nr:hypothetical protein KEM56_000607 [Ascosphaera pollenicola]